MDVLLSRPIIPPINNSRCWMHCNARTVSAPTLRPSSGRPKPCRTRLKY